MPADPAAVTGAAPPHRSASGTILGAAGLILHITLIAFVYLITGLVAPLYALLVLWVVWAALLVVAIRWFRGDTRARALAVPFIALGVWLVVLTLGSQLLGWTP